MDCKLLFFKHEPFFTLNYLVDNFLENVYAEPGGYDELKIVMINIH